MQVTNTSAQNGYTSTQEPNVDGAGFGGAMQTASAEAGTVAIDPHRRAVLDGALARMETMMNDHGAPEMAPLAKRLLENAAEQMPDSPTHIFEQNVSEMIPAHILHHLFSRTGKVDDPNAPERGPINIPVLDENGALTNLSLRFPDQFRIQQHVDQFKIDQSREARREQQVERNEQFERDRLQSDVSALYSRQTQLQIPQQMHAHGAPHLIAPANWTLSEAGREMRLNPDEFTIENMNILQAHIIHHLLARDGIIDDPNAPTEGPIFVPQYLADGTMHHVPVELLMEPLPRHEA